MRYCLNNYKKTPPDLLHWQRSVRITNLPFFANQLDCSAVFAINLNIGKRRNADQIHTDRSKIAAGNGNCFYCLICRTSTDCLYLYIFFSRITPAIAPATEFGDECDDTFNTSMIKASLSTTNDSMLYSIFRL